MEHKLLISLRLAHIRVRLWRRVAEGVFSNAAKSPTLTLKTRAGCVITPTSQLYSGNDPPPLPANVAAAYGSYPIAARDVLLNLRAMIFQTAALNPIIGPLSEVLKRGEPSYLTEVSKSGTTVRIPWHAKHPDQIGLYLNCKTTLEDTMREIYPDTFTLSAHPRRAICAGSAATK